MTDLKPTQPPLQATIQKVLFDLKNLVNDPTNRVAAAWSRVAGEKIANHTQPYALRKGTLYVAVDDPNWNFELTRRHRSAILKKLQEQFGGELVRNLHFTSRPA